MNRTQARTLHSQFNTLALDLAKKLDLTLDPRVKCRYTDSTITFTLTLTEGTLDSKRADDFKRECYLLGFEPDDYGKTFEYFGNEYKFIGFRPRSSKRPCVVERKDGKQFVIGALIVAKGIGRELPAWMKE